MTPRPPDDDHQPRPEVVTRERARSARQDWIERATSADHKTVALLFIATALAFLALAATEFALMRMQLIVPENDADPARDLQPADDRLGRHRSSSSACIPLVLGLIGYIVPLQIGARGVALPRLNQLSYWLYLAGAVTIYGSFLYSVPGDRHGGAAAALRHGLLALERRRRLDRRHRRSPASASPASRST